VNPAPDLSPYRLANVRAAIGHYLLGRGASAVFGIATTILLVRVMNVADYAGYVALMGLAGIASMLSSLGLDRAITRYVPEGRLYHTEDRLRYFAWKVVIARLVAILLVTLLLAVAWPGLLTLFDFVKLDHVPWALAIFLVSTSLFTTLSTILQALVRQKLLTQVVVFIWAGRFVAILYVAYSLGGLGLTQALWLMAMPELVGAAALLVAVGKALRHGGTPPASTAIPVATSWPQWQEVRSLAGHAYVFNVLASVPQGYFMRTLVAATLPVDVVAAYGFFSNLVDKLRMYLPIQLMYNLVEPVLVARYLKNKDEHALSRYIGLIYKANLLIVAMALLFLAISGQTAVSFLTGGKYVVHTWILSLLVLQIAMGSHVLAIQLVVNVLKKNHILSVSAAVALTVMLVFLTCTLIGEHPMLVLFGTLVYSVTMNTTAFLLVARNGIAYRPPIKDAAMLIGIGVGMALVINTVVFAVGQLGSPSLEVLLASGAALMLAAVSMKCRYASQQEVGMLQSLLRARSRS
jgi:pyruvyl transferase EpsO